MWLTFGCDLDIFFVHAIMTMATDETKNTPGDRRQILDEIRRRAEEAELQRLDEEEREQPVESASGHAPPAPPPTPFPAPSPDAGTSGGRSAIEERTVILRERFSIALDRGKLDKAADLLRDLEALVPDNAELPRLRAKLNRLQEARRVMSEQTPPAAAPAPPPVVPPAPSQREVSSSSRSPRPTSQRSPSPPSAPAATPSQKAPQQMSREERMAFRRKIGALLEQANALYQQEKYDEASARVDDVFAIDAQNDDGRKLKGQIEKARRIADMLRRESAEKKSQAGVPPPLPAPARPPTAAKEADPWGTTVAPQHDVGFDLAPQEKGPAGPPKPSMLERIVGGLSGIEFPIRPVATVVGIAAIGVAAYFVVERLVSTVVPGKTLVLVLPATGDPADSAIAAIADGLTDELIRDLTQVSDLRVLNPVTAFGLRRSTSAPIALSRNVGAGLVFHWNVQRNSEGIAYQGSLLDTSTGKPRWTVRQTASFAGLSGVPHELARGLLRAANITPEPQVETMLRASPTDSPEAYAASLRARMMLRRPELYPPAPVLDAFEQVSRIDSTFPDAQAGLGWALILAYESAATPPGPLLNRAAFCVQRAVAGGGKTSEVFRVWGMMEFFRGNFDKAEERFQEAVTLAPSDAEAQRRLAMLFAARGKTDLAVSAARRATNDDPGNSASWLALGAALHSKALFHPSGKDDLRRAYQALEQGYRVAKDRSDYASGVYSDLLVYLDMPDRAMEVLADRVARVRSRYEDLYKMGRVQQTAGRPKEEWQGTFTRAQEVLTEVLAANPDDTQGLTSMALVQTRLGAFKEASASIRRALLAAPGDVDVLYGAAKVFALQRDRKQAFDNLGKALARRYSLAQVLDMDFYNLRPDEQFLQTIKK